MTKQVKTNASANQQVFQPIDHQNETTNMFELLDNVTQQAVIKVIGVGGGGGNAVDNMVAGDFDGVEFVNANTDAQALNRSTATAKLQIGTNLTKGLGAGANPEIGRQAAMEDRDRIAEVIEHADMCLLPREWVAVPVPVQHLSLPRLPVKLGHLRLLS